MKRCSALPQIAIVMVAILIGGLPSAARACAACYGQSDSPLAQGFNWGILSLLAVVVCVLGAITGFFVFLARRAAAQAAAKVVLENQNPVTVH